MSHTERNEISTRYAPALMGRAGARESVRRRQRLLCAAWQGARLILLSWSLLCLYAALKAVLGIRGIDLPAVGLNLFLGIATWWLACRAITPPVWGSRS